MKTDKAAGSGAKENLTLSEKQAVSWHWKPTCSKAPPHPLIKALAHTETHGHTNAQQLACRTGPRKAQNAYPTALWRGPMASRACSLGGSKPKGLGHTLPSGENSFASSSTW